MKVNFAHRACNAFEREPSERDHSRLPRALSSARAIIERDLQFLIYSVEYTEFMEVRKCNVSAMFVFPVHLYRLIHWGQH